MVGVGAAIGADGGRFTTPDQLGPTQPKAAPAAAHQVVRQAVSFGIPAFHGQHGKAVADGIAVGAMRFGQR